MKPLRIEVTEEIRRVVAKDGKTFEKQVGYAYLQGPNGEDRHPSKVELPVGRDGVKAPGMYALDMTSIRVGSRFPQLEVGWPQLVPLASK